MIIHYIFQSLQFQSLNTSFKRKELKGEISTRILIEMPGIVECCKGKVDHDLHLMIQQAGWWLSKTTLVDSACSRCNLPSTFDGKIEGWIWSRSPQPFVKKKSNNHDPAGFITRSVKKKDAGPRTKNLKTLALIISCNFGCQNSFLPFLHHWSPPSEPTVIANNDSDYFLLLAAAFAAADKIEKFSRG